jgi:hypothetical protein
MTFNQTYNVNWELCECLDILYEILDFLDDIRLALELEEDIDKEFSTHLLIPSKPLENTAKQ